MATAVHTTTAENSLGVESDAQSRTPLETMLGEYRRTHREWAAALEGDYDRDMTDEESLAYQTKVAEPCDAAMEAMVEAPVLSVGDVATKLRFLSEVVATLGVGSTTKEARVINNLLRDIEAAKVHTVAPTAFSPSTFAEQVIEAVLPLIDESGTNLKEGTTETDVVRALRPLFGHFTVYDAVMVHFMLDTAGNTDCETPEGKDNPRSHAIYEAREAIVAFVCTARASSARCAEARVHLAEHEGDIDEAPHGNIHHAISADLTAVRYGRYRGQRFGDIDIAEDGWLPASMVDEKQRAALYQGGDDAA